jgi:hypothetical protein
VDVTAKLLSTGEELRNSRSAMPASKAGSCSTFYPQISGNVSNISIRIWLDVIVRCQVDCYID